jgi:hypothetical protein
VNKWVGASRACVEYSPFRAADEVLMSLLLICLLAVIAVVVSLLKGRRWGENLVSTQMQAVALAE